MQFGMMKLAWRNLWRNRTRTLIAASAIAIGLALLLVGRGMQADQYGKMRDSALRSAGGSVLVHADGYWLEQTSEHVVPDAAARVALLEGVEGVDTVIPRILVNGLLASPRGAAGARLTGFDPEREAVLNDWSRFIVEGSFLAGDEVDPLVLGRGVVELLEIELGDRVVLTATDSEGEVTRALFHLTGILETGSGMLDDSLAFTSLEAAAEAMRTGDGVTQIGVVGTASPEVLQQRVLAALDGADDLEVLTWSEALPELVGAIEIDRTMAEIYGIVLFIIVGFGIANTFLMIVLERIRELGLLGAMGLTPARIGRLIMAEAVLMSAVSITVGVTLGYLGHLWLASTGIDVGEMVGGDYDISGIAMDDLVIRSRVVVSEWLVASGFVFVMVMLSSLYPAIRATRLDPATAMRTYE